MKFPELDERGTPKDKLPNCPRCGKDELGAIHEELVLCYACGWTLDRFMQTLVSPKRNTVAKHAKTDREVSPLPIPEA